VAQKGPIYGYSYMGTRVEDWKRLGYAFSVQGLGYAYLCTRFERVR